MANPSFLQGAQALFGACLLHHELHKLLKGQRRSVEPFERQRFEQRGALENQPRTRFGRQMQGHLLAGQGLSDIVVFQIDADLPPAVDRAHHVQAVADLQPAIRIDHVGDRWQLRQVRKSRARRTIATTAPLMRTLIVVMLLELLGHGLHLFQSRRVLHSQAFFLIAAMIALHNSRYATDKTVHVSFPHFCGIEKAESILFQREKQEHEKSPKDVYPGV
jgi:hypothetical protein